MLPNTSAGMRNSSRVSKVWPDMSERPLPSRKRSHMGNVGGTLDFLCRLTRADAASGAAWIETPLSVRITGGTE